MSYLGRLAQRSVGTSPSIAPPKRIGRVLPVEMARPVEIDAVQTVPHEVRTPMQTPAPLAPARSVTAPPPIAPAHREPPAPPVAPAPAVVATTPAPIAVAAAHPIAPPAVLPVVKPPAPRPPADFTFERRRAVTPRTREDIPPVEAPPTTTSPTTAPRPNVLVRHSPVTEPIAAALSAAVRWTSSEDKPPVVPSPRVIPARAPAATPRLAPPEPARERVTVETRVVAMPAVETRRRSTPTAATPTKPEPQPSIRIGSIDVQVIKPPEPLAPPTKPSAAPTPAGSLARGLTTTIGLRQS